MTNKVDAVDRVLSLAGGKIVGKTRIQKSVFVLELAGVGFGFPFSYYRFGPYSEEFAWALKDAKIEGHITEKEEPARWGGTYSVFSSNSGSSEVRDNVDRTRAELLAIANVADVVALELATTAALLRKEGKEDWWGETKRRKPLKATDELVAEAKELWQHFSAVRTPEALPAI